ncbi:MAG: D-aminoacyl-tRNA deacylase [Eubacteriales bacterium]
MTAVIQRVSSASVTADGDDRGSIGRGLCILLGVAVGDTDEDARLLADKIVRMRIFEDENGKMNLSPESVGGAYLIVSNFTLCADCRHGSRPDFFGAARPDDAKRLYEYFISLVWDSGGDIVTGVFGADMKLSLINDGPVTIVLTSEMLRKRKS